MRPADPTRGTPVARLVSLAVLLGPAAALGLLTTRHPSALLAGGTAVALLFAAVLVRYPIAWHAPAGRTTVGFYLTAFCWAWWNTREMADPVAPLVRGVLLLIPAVCLAAYDLHRTGAGPRRRATTLCRRLQNRSQWPRDLREVGNLADVVALRRAAAVDPGPVFDLFDDPRGEVRAAAFAALTGKPYWRPRESQALLAAAQRTTEPAVRIVAATAIGSVDDAGTLAGLSAFLRDPTPEVRAAAAAAAVDAGGEKWAAVRDAVRAALSDPKLQADGPLPGAAGHLSAVAVCDLTTWAGEGEPLGGRATRTLIDHYARLLQTTNDYDIVIDLGRQVTDADAPPALRVELGGLLRSLNLLTPELLDRMTNAEQPGPVRLLAAEALLAANPNDQDGIDVLRGLGRQMNREIALTIARVVQTYLGVNLGLPANGVAAKSKEAGEVARLVFAWATNKGAGNPNVSTALMPVLMPTPEGRPGLPPGDPPPRPPAAPPKGALKLW